MLDAQIESRPTSPGGAAWRWLKLGVVAALLIGLVVAGRGAGAWVESFAAYVDGLGYFGPLVFIVGYALAVVAFVPGSILTLGAGAIFGLAAGTGYVFVAATLGACAAFLIARYLARSTIEAKVAGHPRFEAISRAIGAEGRKITFLLRLSPVFPFTPLNYLLGLTKVSFRDYALACFGMIPGTLLYVYLGKVAGEVISIAGNSATADASTKSPLETAFLFFGLAVTVFVTVYVTRVARKALQEATGDEC